MPSVEINTRVRTRLGRAKRTAAGQHCRRKREPRRKPRKSRGASPRASLHHARKSWREDRRKAEASVAALWKNLAKVRCPTITSGKDSGPFRCLTCFVAHRKQAGQCTETDSIGGKVPVRNIFLLHS